MAHCVLLTLFVVPSFFSPLKIVMACDDSQLRFCNYAGEVRGLGTHQASIYATVFTDDGAAPGHAKVRCHVGKGRFRRGIWERNRHFNLALLAL